MTERAEQRPVEIEAVRTFLSRAAHPHPKVRHNAEVWFEEQGHAVIRPLRKILLTPEPRDIAPVRIAAMHQLAAMLGYGRAEVAPRAIHASERLPVSVQAAILKALERALHNDPFPEVRVATAYQLGMTKHPSAISPLYRALSDGSGEVRTSVLAALDTIAREHGESKVRHHDLQPLRVVFPLLKRARGGSITDPSNIVHGALERVFSGKFKTAKDVEGFLERSRRFGSSLT